MYDVLILKVIESFSTDRRTMLAVVNFLKSSYEALDFCMDLIIEGFISSALDSLCEDFQERVENRYIIQFICGFKFVRKRV